MIREASTISKTRVLGFIRNESATIDLALGSDGTCCIQPMFATHAAAGQIFVYEQRIFSRRLRCSANFRAIIKMVDGVPKVTWEPDLKGLREYQIWGKAVLDDSSAWEYPTNALHRFFKVMVEMP